MIILNIYLCIIILSIICYLFYFIDLHLTNTNFATKKIHLYLKNIVLLLTYIKTMQYNNRLYYLHKKYIKTKYITSYLKTIPFKNICITCIVVHIITLLYLSNSILSYNILLYFLLFFLFCFFSIFLKNCMTNVNKMFKEYFFPKLSFIIILNSVLLLPIILKFFNDKIYHLVSEPTKQIIW